MSAFICSQEHIKRLAVFASMNQNGRINVDPRYLDLGQVNPAAVERLKNADLATFYANVLYLENVRSVQHRYPEDTWETLPGPISKPLHCTVSNEEFYRHSDKINAVELLKLCNCIEYQSCETDDYKSSIAWRVLEAIRDAAVRRLPGYEEAEWAI